MIRLACPDDSQDYLVGVDASLEGWGGVLYQNRKPVLCCSGLWSDNLHKKFESMNEVGKWNLSNECEAEALHRILMVLKPYIWGLPVTVVSDNKAVVSFSNPSNCSPFIRRRLHNVLDVCPNIQFVCGTSNCLPDFLSRCRTFGVAFPNTIEKGKSEKVTCQVTTTSVEDWEKLHAGHFGLDTIMYRSGLWNIPISRTEAVERLSKCKVCQAFQNLRRDTPLHPPIETSYPGQVVALDFIGPTDGRYVLVMVDRFSRLVRLFLTRSTQHSVVMNALSNWRRTLGPMLCVQLDNAKSFTAHAFRTWLDQLGVKAIYSNPYDHRSHGLVERGIKTRYLGDAWSVPVDTCSFYAFADATGINQEVPGKCDLNLMPGVSGPQFPSALSVCYKEGSKTCNK
ncbi:hypothetical protein BSKO_13278 [Bryopsis sp. KO-2023]|nr:hypothetical protein BSKO_13278 [Bryopsis sp. KO-2023]